MVLLALLAALLTTIGLALTLAGPALVRGFVADRPPVDAPLPAISVLKPLYRDEALLEQALGTICAQDYPCYQVVVGVQQPDDPALAVVDRVRRRYPACDIAVVVDNTSPGSNRKVANLENMLAAAKHDVLVIADSDVHAAPDYLRRIAAALAEPRTGLVTTVYSGLPASGSLTGALGASAITHGFLPGALMARALGRQDALGATMALRRETLAAVGGFAALRDHLADDNVLGRRVRARGLAIGMAATVPATTVPETRLADLFRHELRWGRTIRTLAPIAFAASVLQYPLAWGLVAVGLSGGEEWAIALFGAAWIARAWAMAAIDHALGTLPLLRPWHMPLRDLMSIAVVAASYMGSRVEWRGQNMRVGTPRLPAEPLGIEQA